MATTLSYPAGIPKYLQQQPGLDQLTNYQQALPGYYDTSGLSKSFETANNAFNQRAEMGFDAQARAANNRAMVAGGRVGSSFAKGALMLGQQANTNDARYKYAQMAAQMQAQLGQQAGQVAGQIADYGQRQQGLVAGFDTSNRNRQLQAKQLAQQKQLALQQMYQQGQQFDKSFGLQQDQFGFQKEQYGNQQRQQAAMRAMQQLGPYPNYYGVGNTAAESQNRIAQQDWMAQQQSLNRFI